MNVVKLGGSLIESPRVLRRWLKVVAAGAGRCVVVPGGGPFADAVRTAQRETGFDDRAAHHMALLAMEQCGLLFASLESSLVAAGSIDAIRTAMQRGRVPVWMPSHLVADAEDISESWDVTSDSLAAWLARKLDASALWLIKACPVTVQEPGQLAALGVVDAAFRRFCVDAPFTVQVLGPRDSSSLAAILVNQPISPIPASAP